MNSESPTVDFDTEFDILQHADSVKSKIPSYEDLKRDTEPEFLKKISTLRETLRNVRLEKPHKKIFVVLGTGGTFQSKKTKDGWRPEGTLGESFHALGLPEDHELYLELIDLMNIDSSQMTVEQWRFIAEMIIELEKTVGADMFDQIIITHGTDTMAKGGAYLSYMLEGFPTSIFLTGSQYAARLPGTDAIDQMRRTLIAAKIACGTSIDSRRIKEVMISCGLQVTRATWAEKLGDTTTNAFGPWNNTATEYDSIDFEEAAQQGRMAQLAPALLDFGKGKGEGKMRYASHAVCAENKPHYEPFTAIEHPADIVPTKLSDKSRGAIARSLIDNDVSTYRQLGSATADDVCVDIIVPAAEHGKIVVCQAAFPDSTVETGTYAAGKGILKLLDHVRRRIPILITSNDSFEAKINVEMHRQGLKPIGHSEGLGNYYHPEDIRRFYDAMETNRFGELIK